MNTEPVSDRLNRNKNNFRKTDVILINEWMKIIDNVKKKNIGINVYECGDRYW